MPRPRVIADRSIEISPVSRDAVNYAKNAVKTLDRVLNMLGAQDKLRLPEELEERIENVPLSDAYAVLTHAIDLLVIVQDQFADFADQPVETAATAANKKVVA